MTATGDANPYEIGLNKNAANFVPLTPPSAFWRAVRRCTPTGRRSSTASAAIAGARPTSAAAGLPGHWRREASGAEILWR